MAKKAFVYDGTNWIDIAQSTADLSNYANMTTTPISGFRNAIINGDFRINQRGFTSTTANSVYTFDRWVTTVAGTQTYSAPSFSPGESPSSGGINYLRIVTTAGASNYATIQQRIEDVRTFAGDTVTISFWAKAASGTPKIDIIPSQNFGSGGSAAVSVTSKAVTLSTAWQRFTHTVTVPSISGKTIGTSSYLALDLQVNNVYNASIGQQSNTFDIWGVQVEKGTTATPFEYRPIGTELALCQRYYINFATPTGTSDFNFPVVREATTVAVATVFLPVTLRATPTIAASNLGRMVMRDTAFNIAGVPGVSAISVSGNGPSLNILTLIITHGAVGGGGVFSEWDLLSTTTNFAFSSEL